MMMLVHGFFSIMVFYSALYLKFRVKLLSNVPCLKCKQSMGCMQGAQNQVQYDTFCCLMCEIIFLFKIEYRTSDKKNHIIMRKKTTWLRNFFQCLLYSNFSFLSRAGLVILIILLVSILFRVKVPFSICFLAPFTMSNEKIIRL